MKLLNELCPAQVYLTLFPIKTPRQQLFKLTLKDLIIKKVITVFDDIKKVPGLETGIIYKYVTKGEKFNDYNAKEFEEIFLSFFKRYPEERILLKNLIKSVYSTIRSNERYYEMIASTYPVNTYLKKTVLRHLFGGYILTQLGKDAHQNISNEINETVIKINTLLSNNDPEIRNVLTQINGNVFLLYGINLDLLQEVDKHFKETERNDVYDGCSGCVSWESFSDISNEIDNGCSGDSGCSGGGCSGCGGCGGGD